MIDMGGTLRARPPKDTLACLKPYAKKAGVTRIADLTGLDEIGLPVYTCIRPNSKNLATSQGKGLTHDLAMCSAYMEAIEHYYAENIPVDLIDSFAHLSEKHAAVSPAALQKGIFQIENMADRSLAWVVMKDLRTGDSVYVPHDFISFDLTQVTLCQALFKKTTTGLASGNTASEARCHALLEIIERRDTHQFQALSEKERNARVLKLETVDYEPAKKLINTFIQRNLHVTIFYMAASEVPAYFAVLTDENPLRTLPNFSGFGAHVHRGVALCRALTEAAQSRLTYIAGSRDDMMPWEYKKPHRPLNCLPVLHYGQTKKLAFETFALIEKFLLTQIQETQVLEKVYTAEDDAIAVVQVIVPALRV